LDLSPFAFRLLPLNLITGARGLVGSALLRAIPTARGVSHSELDIADRAAVRDGILSLRPEVIFNCAVVGVDECERDPALARRVNVDGPAHLAEAAEEIGAAVVHFSSNYVFDGEERRFYRVDDEPRPINVYGRTKLEGERAVADRCSRATIIRTSWVYGPGKASFLSTVAARLRQSEQVHAISDTWASCTYVEDLVARVLESRRPGTFHVVNAGVCSYENFALEAARLVGARDRLIKPIPETREAPRPRYTPLECLPPLRPWPEALAEWVRAVPREA
jgi:dTDP-4-dehydrorhamnose reductase